MTPLCSMPQSVSHVSESFSGSQNNMNNRNGISRSQSQRLPNSFTSFTPKPTYVPSSTPMARTLSFSQQLTQMPEDEDPKVASQHRSLGEELKSNEEWKIRSETLLEEIAGKLDSLTKAREEFRRKQESLLADLEERLARDIEKWRSEEPKTSCTEETKEQIDRLSSTLVSRFETIGKELSKLNEIQAKQTLVLEQQTNVVGSKLEKVEQAVEKVESSLENIVRQMKDQQQQRDHHGIGSTQPDFNPIVESFQQHVEDLFGRSERKIFSQMKDMEQRLQEQHQQQQQSMLRMTTPRNRTRSPSNQNILSSPPVRSSLKRSEPSAPQAPSKQKAPAKRRKTPKEKSVSEITNFRKNLMRQLLTMDK